MSDDIKNKEDEAARLLKEKENASTIKYDDTPKKNDEVVSLGKSEQWKADQERAADTGEDFGIGWKPYPLESLPSAGLFYPEGTTFAIKPASVEEIRHFSTIDENDPLDVDDKLNMVTAKCLQIKFPDRHASWKDLKEEDRFCLVFAIRDITFKNGENKLFLNLKCGTTCQGDGTFSDKIEMKNDNFDYYSIDPKLMKHYSHEEKCFVINSPKVGMIKMYVPSLGVTTYIKSYMRERIRKGEFYDKTFLKVAPFIFSDWRTLNNDAMYKKAEQDSYGWNPLKLSAIVQMAEMIRFGVKTKVVRQCNKCGAEVSTPLAFTGGAKSLFLFGDALSDIL